VEKTDGPAEWLLWHQHRDNAGPRRVPVRLESQRERKRERDKERERENDGEKGMREEEKNHVERYTDIVHLYRSRRRPYLKMRRRYESRAMTSLPLIGLVVSIN
jgi:hypothetical protein